MFGLGRRSRIGVFAFIVKRFRVFIAPLQFAMYFSPITNNKSMDITNNFKEEILNSTTSIENVEVVYKKNKYDGKLLKVKQSPFEMTIYDKDLKR
ncbi:hypothetical protein [Chryseobacterium indoltheticum]|uniref:hypothetical protein n=1 Tax=Chryseobacterium indoltheticum TaxID=254 RepID=UPI003F49704F